MKYYFSLGSNQGDKLINIHKAITFLKGMGRLVSKSSTYRTAPVDMPGETEDFLNLVLVVDTDISPMDMLKKIKHFEKKLGREKLNSGYDPRPIDIDILMVDDLVIREEKLVVPHPRMSKRTFVLIPLLEIAPDMVHPICKKSFREILNNLSENQRVVKIN